VGNLNTADNRIIPKADKKTDKPKTQKEQLRNG
jgi:hypothetical protein